METQLYGETPVLTLNSSFYRFCKTETMKYIKKISQQSENKT